MTERNLYIIGDLTPERVRYIKEAKYKIDPGFNVRLEAYSEGTHAPLIAFQVPPSLPDLPYANAAYVDSSDRMQVALEELWGIREPVHLTTAAQWLSAVLGVRVTEID